MAVNGLHHVAYRCKDAKETADFYTKYLDLDFNVAFAENLVPSTGEWSPHIHIFLQMKDGSSVAFFELPESKEMSFDPNTPQWVQHLALAVDNEDQLITYKKRLEAGGVPVLGPTDHGMCKSIYFFDPNGHRLELSIDTTTPEMSAKLRARSGQVLEHWSKTKRAPDMDEMHVKTHADRQNH